MKKILLLTAVLIGQYSVSQNCDPNIIANFECNSSFSLPTTVQAIANSFSGGINTSDNIGEYTDNGTEGFDALIIDYGSAIDLSTNNQLKIKLYSPTRSIQILAKLEGGNAQEVYSPFSQTGEWQEFIFDFSASDGAGNTRIVLFFDVAVTSGNTTELYYFDDLEWTSQSALSTSNNTLQGVDLFTSNNTLFIKGLDHENGHVKIYSLFGTVVREEKILFETNNEIDLSDLSSGIYIVKLTTNTGELSRKIVVE